ncbi:MAG: 2-oxo acid dehydrogenase subunit E2 [Actinobacteria bacterium]|nr:2-oxo acid dehydrogenase subunit E2 [Actinomycetota bacterium]
MHEVIMPKLGLTMETGKIEKWIKKEGDRVEAGDVLFEVMTDKVSLEVEAYNSGILRKILRGEGEEVPVTEVVAYIGEESEEIPEYVPGGGKEDREEEKVVAESDAGKKEPPVEIPEKLGVEEKTAQQEPQIPEDRIAISPLAKKLAAENNIDISLIKGSGPRGRIVREDVENFIAKPEQQAGSKSGDKRIKISPLARKTAREMGIDWKAVHIEGSGPGGRIVKEDILSAAKAEETIKPEPVSSGKPGELRIKSKSALTGMRKVIAQRMSQSKSTIPHIVLNRTVDVTKLIEFRESLKDRMMQKYGIKVTYTDLILKAAALALRENIEVNSSLLDGNYIVYDDVNVGMATAVEEGLIVPTLFSCDKMEIIDIARKRIEFMDKAKNRKLSIEEISGGTFTVTNLGMYGIRNFSAIINPPQAAILAVGEIYSGVAVKNGNIEARSFMDLSVSCDHRIVDGAAGARFLQKIAGLIENPVSLVI